MASLHWDIFCRVVDNFGDAGVCWRLARELALRGGAVRLVIDDPAPLAWMAPGGQPGVQVLRWPGPDRAGDVVIEAFGCDPPEPFVAAMAARPHPPVWINLEYLSAEPYVERTHGLPSPQRNGLTKWFFYPGFTPRTGGLLQGPGLLAERKAFDVTGWLAELGLQRQASERVVSLFCYDNPALPALLHSLSSQPTLLLLTPGAAQRQVQAQTANLRLARLPWLSQADFDRLLWASDINFVRGEDSLVRAIWAGAPLVWQAYPQQDGAHFAKVQALLGQMGAAPDMAALWWAWNGLPGQQWPGLPELEPWQQGIQAWRRQLLAEPDLVTQLTSFVLGKSPTAC